MAEHKILIVEDNALNLKLVRNLLQLGGFKPLEASNAEFGIQLAQKHLPDLILMDIQLPGMDGLTATRQIKADPSLRETPVLALTSHAMSGDEERALAAGCSDYITKPIDTRKFLDRVKKYLPKEGGKPVAKRSKNTRHMPRILIVDDDPMNVKLLAAKLEAEDYDILRAYGGKECVKIAMESLPDLILLDIMMPDMDGYKVTRRLKGDAKTGHIPIILVTALDGTEFKTTGLESGADEFLSKPVNGTELLSRIHSMLRLKQYQEQMTIRTHSENLFDKPLEESTSPAQEEKVSRVLVVEDDEKDIKLLENYLADLPIEIVAAKDGREAISYALKAPVDLILLDIILPGIDGFEVCRRLKEMKETKNVQIIMITCLNDLESKIKGVEKGADDFLIKPINRRELSARVRSLIKKKSYLDKLHLHYEAALNSAITDGLTSLYNYAYFTRFLHLEVKRAVRQGHSTALFMLDIDDFKNINDTFGHLTGDVILRELSKIIMENIREIDLAARYGGEEFAVVLPNADPEGAMSVAERILEKIRSHRFFCDTAMVPLNVTASIGIAFCPGDASTEKELVLKADSMLYKAKRLGKDQVCLYEPTQEQEDGNETTGGKKAQPLDFAHTIDASSKEAADRALPANETSLDIPC